MVKLYTRLVDPHGGETARFCALNGAVGFPPPQYAQLERTPESWWVSRVRRCSVDLAGNELVDEVLVFRFSDSGALLSLVQRPTQEMVSR
jgi:hypothetical protein